MAVLGQSSVLPSLPGPLVPMQGQTLLEVEKQAEQTVELALPQGVYLDISTKR